ncbi:hypothetical protein HOA92_00550 [archaeon]|mgnify:FL=1|jgi:hypothetical protein|nr:hypothetical protein [archaeon]MBT6761506.1 hypothetical protein [archaeon]
MHNLKYTFSTATGDQTNSSANATPVFEFDNKKTAVASRIRANLSDHLGINVPETNYAFADIKAYGIFDPKFNAVVVKREIYEGTMDLTGLQIGGVDVENPEDLLTQILTHELGHAIFFRDYDQKISEITQKKRYGRLNGQLISSVDEAFAYWVQSSATGLRALNDELAEGRTDCSVNYLKQFYQNFLETEKNKGIAYLLKNLHYQVGHILYCGERAVTLDEKTNKEEPKILREKGIHSPYSSLIPQISLMKMNFDF